MKTSTLLKVGTLGLAIAACNLGYADNITIADPHKDSAAFSFPSGPQPDSGTVEYNAIANNTWDLRQFTLDGLSLAIGGGFNFDTGKAGSAVGRSDYTTPIGDIFVYLGKAPYTVGTGPSSAPDPIAVAATPDYIISFGRDGASTVDVATDGKFSTQSIVGGTWLPTSGTSSLYPGLPWKYGSGGKLEATGNGIYSSSGGSLLCGF